MVSDQTGCMVFNHTQRANADLCTSCSIDNMAVVGSSLAKRDAFSSICNGQKK